MYLSRLFFSASLYLLCQYEYVFLVIRLFNIYLLIMFKIKVLLIPTVGYLDACLY